MRRHVATFVAAALLLASVAGPVAAGAGPRAADAVTGGVATTAASADPADPTGRWIVLYKGGTDAASATRLRTARGGFHADRTFTHGIHGFSARLTGAQVDALRRDSAVAQVVPDERIQVEGQINPTGISRIGARVSKAAKIDGIDDRVDADVAIVDTGIAKVPDLNVVGGHDCSTSTTHPLARRLRPRDARGGHRRGDRQRRRASSASHRAFASGPSRSSTTPAPGCCRGTPAGSTGSTPSATRSTRASRSSKP